MSAKKKHEDAAAEQEQAQTAGTAETEAPETPETAAEPTAEQAQAPESAKAEEKGDTDRYLRLLAEFDNYKKRSAKERENIYTDVRVDTVTKFLPVYDNLERAMKAETADESYRKGVEMTCNQLLDVFKKLGVEPIESVGQTFDPQVHNAVMHVEDEALGENTVVEEFQKGFKIGDRVIRHSMVKVAN